MVEWWSLRRAGIAAAPPVPLARLACTYSPALRRLHLLATLRRLHLLATLRRLHLLATLRRLHLIAALNRRTCSRHCPHCPPRQFRPFFLSARRSVRGRCALPGNVKAGRCCCAAAARAFSTKLATKLATKMGCAASPRRTLLCDLRASAVKTYLQKKGAGQVISLAGPAIKFRRRATLPRANPAVPSPLRPFTAVFGMETGVAFPPWSPENCAPACRREKECIVDWAGNTAHCALRVFVLWKNGQASRRISTGRLSGSPRLHLRPIEVVVFNLP